jgi:large subunit ribosomal protein L13
MSNKTLSAKATEIDRKWYVVSAAGLPLGRLAAHVAAVLRGKHRPIFTPHVDCGDFVIVTDAEKVVLTGRKLSQKMLYTHSGYPGALRETKYEHFLAKDAAGVVKKAVRGMLPHNRLGRQLIKKLRVYVGPEHPHAAQQPQPLDIPERRV